MQDLHLTTDDMPLFTRLRMTAFGEAVIDIANDPTYDQWTFSQKIRHALEQETAARTERRVLKLLKASRTPNPAACVEDIRYLDGRNLNRELVARLAACRWIWAAPFIRSGRCASRRFPVDGCIAERSRPVRGIRAMSAGGHGCTRSSSRRSRPGRAAASRSC